MAQEIIDQVKESLQATAREIKSAVEARDAELKTLKTVSDETHKRLTDATAKFDQIQADLTELKSMDARLIEMEKAAQRQFGQEQAAKSWGQQFVESEDYKTASSRGQKGTGAVSVQKDITSLAASAGALINPQRRADVVIAPNRPFFVRDMLTTLPTTSNAVEVMRQNVFTNNANMQGVAQASAYELVAKPQSEITYELVTVPVRTLAHWVAASRQVMSDAPMLQRLIDDRLTYGLALKVDQQLLYGAGTGQQFTGLMVDSGVSDLGDIPALAVDETVEGAMIDHIRRAITVCQINEFYNINGLVLNPQDWEKIELAKGSDGHYIWVTVPNGGENRLWRVPVSVTNAITAGEFILGDFRMGATIYDREDLQIRVAEQHADYFVKNGVVVLAEERLGFGIELPKAFTKGSFTVLT